MSSSLLKFGVSSSFDATFSKVASFCLSLMLTFSFSWELDDLDAGLKVKMFSGLMTLILLLTGLLRLAPMLRILVFTSVAMVSSRGVL